MEFEKLKYGDIIYGKSREIPKSEIKEDKTGKKKMVQKGHFIVILADKVFCRKSGSRAPLQIGISLSSTIKIMPGDLIIRKEQLPPEIVNHFKSEGFLKDYSYWIISKPVIIRPCDVERVLKVRIDDFFSQFGVHACQHLCEDGKYLAGDYFKSNKIEEPTLSEVSTKCTCDNCGCMAPYELKIAEGKGLLNMCPSFIQEMQAHAGDLVDVQCSRFNYNLLVLKKERLLRGELEDGESNYTIVEVEEQLKNEWEMMQSLGAAC